MKTDAFIEVAALTQQLVQTPSFVAEGNDETAVGAMLAELLASDKRLQVEVEAVRSRRHNVVATTPGPPSLLLAGHMDTVVPCGGWQHDPFEGTIDGDRLYGLGALDMKGGVAAIASSVLNATQLPPGLTVLFYCDEEYDFAGMRSFLRLRQLEEERPTLAVVGEPSEEKIWNSHRGVIELMLSFTGRSAHAARPDSGVNAILAGISACLAVKAELADDPEPLLGISTLNIAAVTGGVRDDSGSVVIQANAVPDFAEVLVDARTASQTLNAQRLADRVGAAAADFGAQLTGVQIRHDLGALSTPSTELRPLERALADAGLPLDYADGATKGYGDGQLIREAWGIPVANFGPKGAGMHASDEFVGLDSLAKVEQVFAALLQRFCQRR